MKQAMQKMKAAMAMAESVFAKYGYDDDKVNGDGDVDESYPDSGDGDKPMDDMKTAKKKMLVQKMKKSMKV